MSLSWKDGVSTLLTAGAITLTIAAVQQWSSAITVRWAIGGMFILGLLACAIGGMSPEKAPPLYLTAMGVLVIAAVLTGVLGLALNSKGFAIAMAVTLGVLWFVATIRHAMLPA